MTQSAGGTKMFWTRKEKPMFKEIEAFAEKVAEKVKSAEAEVKQYFNDKKARAVAQFKFDLEHFEASLLDGRHQARRRVQCRPRQDQGEARSRRGRAQGQGDVKFQRTIHGLFTVSFKTVNQINPATNEPTGVVLDSWQEIQAASAMGLEELQEPDRQDRKGTRKHAHRGKDCSAPRGGGQNDQAKG